MRLAIVVLAALSACRGKPDTQPTQVSVPASVGSATASAPAPAPAAAAKPDPWAAPLPASDPADPPTFAERHRFAQTHCPRIVHPYYYSVEKDHHTSYLLGTRHAGVSLEKMPQAVKDRVRSATLAVFEVAPDDHGSIPDQKLDLRAALGDEVWNHYRELVGDQVADQLRVGSPVVASVELLALYEDISAMLDGEIQRAVADAHIPARGLETSKFQDTLLAKLLDLRSLRAQISQTKTRKDLESDAAEDLEGYCKGDDDTPGTDAKARTHMKAAGYTDAEIDNFDEQLVYARNRDWIPKLETMFTKDGVLVVVGCDHLKGPKGVPALLEKRGFHVTRLAAP